MGKRKALFEEEQLTLFVNGPVLSYLEDLARTGLYGNDHGQIAVVVLRHGFQHLIETGVLKPREWALPRPDETDDSRT